MKILAIDPATLTGWAHSDGLSGTWDLNILRDESADMRLVRFRGKLNEIHREVGVELVVYEAVRFAPGGGALVVAGEVQAIIKLWAHDAIVPYCGLSSTEIKKHATGSGNANKAKMLMAAEQKWPDRFKRPKDSMPDDNEIDAMWILDLAKLKYDQELPCPECEGRGRRLPRPCIACEGTGKENAGEDLLRVPEA